MANVKGEKNQGPQEKRGGKLTWKPPLWLVKIFAALAAAKRMRVSASRGLLDATVACKAMEDLAREAVRCLPKSDRPAANKLRKAGVLPRGFGSSPLSRNHGLLYDKKGRVRPFHPKEAR